MSPRWKALILRSKWKALILRSRWKTLILKIRRKALVLRRHTCTMKPAPLVKCPLLTPRQNLRGL
jgi:hypothetical protein